MSSASTHHIAQMPNINKSTDANLGNCIRRQIVPPDPFLIFFFFGSDTLFPLVSATLC